MRHTRGVVPTLTQYVINKNLHLSRQTLSVRLPYLSVCLSLPLPFKTFQHTLNSTFVGICTKKMVLKFIDAFAVYWLCK